VEGTHDPFPVSPEQDWTDGIRAHARNGDPLLPGVFAAQNPDALARHAQPFGEQRNQGLIRGSFDGRSGEPHKHSLAAHPRYLIPLRAWDDADVDLDARSCVANQGRDSDLELERELRS
jgi:hypothetical protein